MYLQSNLEKLIKRKKQLGWTNHQLAEKSGVPAGTVNKIFSGATRYPRQETLDALVKALELDYYNVEDYGAGVSIVKESSAYAARNDTLATIETYYALPHDTRAELINGQIYYMSAPSANHQIILGELSALFRDYLRKADSRCRGFMAPYDVQLDMDAYTIVQPDYVVICDEKKYENGIRCQGAPDFVLEIVSPSNPRHDYFLKLQKYQNAGVREYWIIDPVRLRVTVYVFELDFIPTVYSFHHSVKATIYPGLEINFNEISSLML